MSNEERRKLHQKQLAKARQEDGLARYSGEKEGNVAERKVMFRKFESYRKEGLLPRNVSDLRVS